MNNKHKKKSIVAVAVFSAMIGSMYFIWTPLKDKINEDVIENRIMAERPTLNIHDIGAYPGQANSYVNDHLPFRGTMVKMNSAVDYYVFHSSSNRDYVIGKNGWLFYNQDDTMPIYKGQKLYSEDQLQTIANNVQRSSDYLERQGVKYVVYIAPEKERIYPEYMPDYYGKPAEVNLLGQVVGYLRANTDVPIVCPYDSLMQAKEDYPDREVYLQTDTHWNAWGGYIGACELFDAIDAKWNGNGIQVEEIKAQPGDEVNGLNLRGIYDCGVDYTVTGYETEGTRPVQEADFFGHYKYESPDAPNGSILVHRDSFSSALMPYITNSFKQSDLVHQISWDNALVEEEHPDVFVYECVERYLDLMLDYNYNNLTCEADPMKYVDKLIEDKERYSIFITVNGDASDVVSPELAEKLQELGLTVDLSAKDNRGKSYAATLYNGHLLEESMSDTTVSYAGTLENGLVYSISSTGGENGNSVLSYDSVDYSMNQSGLNILVYDNEHNVGIDACVLHDGKKMERR